MPGLGGDPNHFHWLSRSLMQAGWPVLVLEHPGSDAAAVQGLLEGVSRLMVPQHFVIGWLTWRRCLRRNNGAI